jgi:lipopolysaccharide/colanic/teichoic acid biosynthesis glycosyltransferase
MEQHIIELEIRDGMGLLSRIVKRVFDIICSLFGLIALSPVFLLVYIMLRRQGDGPVIFKQERIGYKGVPFYILKFRTMRVGSENATPILAQKDDSRLTPVGKFLREHHLDELPQLWNVFKGEMSFVGPRPERKYFIDKIKEHNSNYDYIYLMRPGLTSMATMYNGYTDTMEKMLIRLQMDLDYLQNRSLLLDLKIIIKTVLLIVYGKKF